MTTGRPRRPGDHRFGLVVSVLAVAAGVIALGSRVVVRRRNYDRVAATLGARRNLPVADGDVRFSVVVPAFRETRIGDTVAAIRSALADIDAAGELEVIVVDDGSHDGTDLRAHNAGADRVLRLAVNRGKGAAVRTAMLPARGRTVAFTDADLSYPPAQLAVVLEGVFGSGVITWNTSQLGNLNDHAHYSLAGATPNCSDLGLSLPRVAQLMRDCLNRQSSRRPSIETLLSTLGVSSP